MNAEWEIQVRRANEGKSLAENISDAVDQLITENLHAFAYTYSIAVPSTDPWEGVDFARYRLQETLKQLESK